MVVHFFTSRSGGVSVASYAGNNLALHVGDRPEAVLENRRVLQETIGPISFMNQSHGDVVAVVEGWTAIEPNSDALVTQTPGIYLAVLTADCIPLLLWDSESVCVAAVHVGRRGLPLKTIAVMRAMGANEISAVLGPSICGKCYEVGEDVYKEVVSHYPDSHSQTSKGRPALDLSAALTGQLAAVGVISARASQCTAESESLFSYRREGSTGRFAGLITL